LTVDVSGRTAAGGATMDRALMLVGAAPRGRGVPRLAAFSILKRVCFPALVSHVAAGLLVLVGFVRVLSYYRPIADQWIHDSFLGFLAYQPDDFFSVRYFKILASLSVVGLLYIIFRVLNRGHRAVFPLGYPSHHRDLDFTSPWVRLALLMVVNFQWVLHEWHKFANKTYPYSPLESWESNAVVLALSGLIAFFTMKHLSFRPLLKDTACGAREA
jgi:hypothetical protein